ncbi:MAG: T9SS type A sorting domain-containing protein, partial [Candidatus Hatepunaea meridiana]|nr:T9SS type A sorting domain-containing protein [Candidatus Hatepunaea meridiana]
EFTITSAYPNPFNSMMSVGFSLSEAAQVQLNVYDLNGRHVSQLASGHHQAGIHTAVFDGSNLASGVYMIRYEAAGHVSRLKIALVK